MGKFRDIASIVVICLLAVVLLASSAQARPASVLLQEGLYAEEIEGNLDAAIKIYEQIAADKSAGARYAAQAMYRLGLCYQKKQDYQNAKATFEKLIARFPEEKSIIEKIQPLLDQMSTQDPAALMPAETLVYLEIGSPGKQIETILNMLKGTPLENPLAVISARGGPGVGVGPAGALASLLNPSMITEFKKIRGVALGFQAIHSNNPPLVAVIYPGESDALRGIIIAGLGMMFQAGEPIAGMQTLRMGDISGAAYDDNIIILASPIDRLTWCVKQYKGITNEPTLVSQNKAFQKLSRKAREQNAYTIWADVDRIFPMLKEEMPDEQRRLIESVGDIGNVDEFTACLSLEENGIAVETNIGFKDGHNCLAYNLIRTPNISKAGFEAVPPEAVAVVSLALSEAKGGGVAGARKALKKLTGLDIGRELFANIEQVTLFALPPTPTSNKHLLAKNISPIVPCLGLAVTSHNSKRTHQLFTQLLTIANLAMNLSMGEESDQPTIPTPGKYRIGIFDDVPAYCYVGQAGKSTILSLTPEVLQTSLPSVKSGKSALSTGPLHEILSQLPSDASKLVTVNAGGAIRLADTHLCQSLDVRSDPNRNLLSKLLGQLAQACDNTNVRLHTGEKANNFALKTSISGLPDFGQVFPLVAQIPEAMENPMLCATRPRPADRAMVKPAKVVELRWEPGRGATAHKVYFGSNIDKLSLLGEVKTPSYDELPTPERGITYYWRVDEVQADGSVVTGDLWSFSTGKLAAWWKFDETSGNTAEDSSGNNHHGTRVHGNPIWKADGKFGGCLDFNERYGISIPKDVFDGIDRAITISVWVYGNQRQRKHSDVILQAGAGDAGKPYIVSIYTNWLDYGLKFATGIGEPDGLEFNPGAPEDWTGRWNHYAFVKNAGKGFQRIYMNGSLVAEKTGAMASMSGVGAARIGIAPDRFGDQHIGRLDDFRIYNYALSTEEIRQLCGIVPGLGPAVEPVEPGPPAPQAPSYLKGLVSHWKFDEGRGTKAYDSEGNNHGTIHGAQWTSGRVNGTLYFDSREDYVSISPVTLSKNWTVSAWCEPLRNEVGGCNPIMGGPEDYDNYIILCEAKHHINLETDTDGDWAIVCKGAVDFNKWAYYTVTRNGNTISAYRNGVHIDDATLPKGGKNTITKIGSGYGAATYYKGRIDDVRIYNRALSAEEIQELYTKVSGFRPAAEVYLSDIGESSKAALYDFDTRRLVGIPDPLRNAGSEERHRWIVRKGLDVGAQFAGDEYGLIGVDVVATRIASEQWDKITPAELRQVLAAESIGVEKDEMQTAMPAKGEYPPTFAFKTREGGAGVLQIYDADRSKKTISFRYKMLAEPLDAEPAPPTVTSFGPVVERTLGDHGQSDHVNGCIDFESGQLFTLSPNIKQEETWPWIRGNGIDALGETDECPMGWIGLRGVDMVALPVDASQWDTITPEAIRQQVSLGKSAWWQDMILPKDSPGTYIFRTREGGMGILQILEVKYVEYTKIRYKMVQPGVEEPVLKLQVVEPKREWWRVEPRITKTIYEGSDLEIEWDVGETRKKIKAFAVGVLPIKEDISDLPAHYYWEDNLAFTVRRTPYGKVWGRSTRSKVSPKTLRPGEYRVYVCAYYRYRYGASWSDRLTDVIGAGTAKLIVKPRPQTHTFAPGLGPAEPPPVDELIKSGRVPAFRTVLHGNSALDLETGAVVSIPIERTRAEVSARPGELIATVTEMPTKAKWPEGFDVAWDNTGGGALVVRPDSAVRIVAIPGAEKERWDQAISLARGALATLRTSTADKILANKTSFAAVLTSEGNLATVQISEFRQTKATLYWWIERPTAKFVGVTHRRVFLPGEDEPGVGVLLDLASGELLQILHPESKRPYGVWPERGRGDLTYDNQFRGGPGGESAYKHGLFCLRGAKARTLEKDGFGKLKIVLQSEDVTGYLLPRFPCRLLVTTAEGDSYEVQALAATENGINLEYRKLPGRPGQPDLAKALELAQGLYGLYQGVVQAIENQDTETALSFVDQLITNGRAFEQMVKGTSAEMYVKAGGPVLEELRVALQKKEIDRARSLVNVFNQIGPPISSALERAVEQQERVNSAQKLSRLGKAVVMYAADNNGKMPATLKELKPYLGGDDFKWLIENVRYFGKGQESKEPDTPIAYDKTLLEKGNGTNVLFLDGHVGFLTPEELERLGIITGKKTQAILG